jgi:hypothetical protein
VSASLPASAEGWRSPTHRTRARAGFGLLVGALALAGLRTGELPRPVAVAGLASAAAGLLSPLYFVAPPAAWFIPAGRMSGLVVSGIAGARLSRRRP